MHHKLHCYALKVACYASQVTMLRNTALQVTFLIITDYLAMQYALKFTGTGFTSYSTLLCISGCTVNYIAFFQGLTKHHTYM